MAGLLAGRRLVWLLFIPAGAALSLARTGAEGGITRLAPAALTLEIEVTGFNRAEALTLITDSARTALSGQLRLLGGESYETGQRLLVKGFLDETGAFAIERAKALPDESIRGALKAGIDNALTELASERRTYGLFAALLLGDRTALGRSELWAFRQAGTAHLLAISGLHVGILFGLLFGILTLFRVSRRWALVLSVLLLLPYGWLLGWLPSATRAILMAAALCGGVIAGRKTLPLNSLGAAGLVSLVIWPQWAASVGFQLSYAAAAFIILYLPLLSRFRGLVGRWLLAPLGVTLAAQAGAAPFLLGSFGWLPLASLPLNIVSIPALAFTLAQLLAALLVYPFGLSAPFAAAANLGGGFILDAASLAASLDPPGLRGSAPLWLTLPLFWGGALWLRWGLLKRLKDPPLRA